MRRILTIYAIVAALGFGQSWNKPGACMTPQATLCRTIEWQDTGWENQSWGFHAIRRWKGTITAAYRRDGAWLERYAFRSFKNYVVQSELWDLAQIKMPAQDQTIEIDRIAAEYEIRPHVRGGLTVWNPEDFDCTKVALAFDLSDLKRGGEVWIAKTRAIEYFGKRSKTRRVTVALAPELGCTQMRFVDRDYNSFGLPTLYRRFEATSVKIGEPAPELFSIPSNLRLKKR